MQNRSQRTTLKTTKKEESHDGLPVQTTSETTATIATAAVIKDVLVGEMIMKMPDHPAANDPAEDAPHPHPQTLDHRLLAAPVAVGMNPAATADASTTHTTHMTSTIHHADHETT